MERSPPVTMAFPVGWVEQRATHQNLWKVPRSN
ncbi:hypothetical protein SAMN05216414_12716, partial [Nitrosovibrio sp. Nv17]